MIASVLGVPLPLVDNDAATYNNVKEAKEQLYTDTAIPMAEDQAGALNKWLVPRFDEGLELRLDLDSIPALEGLRQRRFDRAVAAYEKGVLTREEAREMIGRDPKSDGTYRPLPGQLTIEQRSGWQIAAKAAYGL